MNHAAVQLSVAEIRQEIDDARKAGTLSDYHVSCQFMEGELEQLGLSSYEEGMSIEDFYAQFLDAQNSKEIQIFLKDRSERGYMRYKILLPLPDGDWSAAIEITCNVHGTRSFSLGPGLIIRL